MAAVAAWSPPQRIRTLAAVPKNTEGVYRERLSRVIVELRAVRGISQAKLAETIERSEAAVSRWETAKATPTAFDLQRLADALDVPHDALDLLVFPPATPVSPIAARVLSSVSAGAHRGLRRRGPSGGGR